MNSYWSCAAVAVTAMLSACSDGSRIGSANGGSAGLGETSSGGVTGGSAAQSGGTSPLSTGGISSGQSGGTATSGGSSGLGGSDSAGGSSSPTSGGAAAGGGMPATGGTQTGGTVSAGGQTGGNAPTGGSGSTTGGAPSSAGAPPGQGGSPAVDRYAGAFKILILSKAIDFPHPSIKDCQNLLKELGATVDANMPAGTKAGSQFTTTVANPDLSDFTDDKLKGYGMLFWCNPTGTVFSTGGNNGKVGMAAIQKFVEGGGAWGGVHSASDFEKTNGFPWFTNTLLGSYFDHHDHEGTTGTVQVQSSFVNHPVVRGVQASWNTEDEWYYMNKDVSSLPDFKILSRLAKDNRPVVWVKELGTDKAGRMFYTIRGHDPSVYKEKDFRTLVLNGILWATHRLE